MNIFSTIADSFKTISDIQADVSAEFNGQEPDYTPLANDLLDFAQGKIKVPSTLSPGKLSAILSALHSLVTAILACFEAQP